MRVAPEVEDRGGEQPVGVADEGALDEMLEAADAPARDHRHAHRVRDAPGQLQVVAGLGPVAVHGGDEDLAGAEPGADSSAQVDGVEARWDAARHG